LLRQARGEAGDADHVCRTLPSMDSHKRYLAKAGIAYEDDRGRRVDFHSLRHTYGSMLAKAGIAPRVAMSLMRHTDLRLTMNTYTDPRIFDLSGAVEKLPAIAVVKADATMKATGTDTAIGRTFCVTYPSAGLGCCSAVIGGNEGGDASNVSLATGGNWQQKTPSGRDGEKERVKGVEPSTFTLAT
jgi:hypothetical protein